MRLTLLTASRMATFLHSPTKRAHYSIATRTLSSSPPPTRLHPPLPKLEKLKSANFMTQVTYGKAITEALFSTRHKYDQENLLTLLQAQLSSSDGIRGFFVSFLTSDSNAISNSFLPEPLQIALKSTPPAYLKVLVSLASMNVIMPTAMSIHYNSLHLLEVENDALDKSHLSLEEKINSKDPMQGSHRSMRDTSIMTASRGIVILEQLLMIEQDNANFGSELLVRKNIEAVIRVASSSVRDREGSGGEPLDEYWAKFYEKWGYDAEQRDEIVKVFRTIS